MSKLRPECGKGTGESLPDETVLFLVRDSVAKRRSLIYGRLRDGKGGNCAMGAFWADNPQVSVSSRLVDEVAAVNDSVPRTATPHQRWKKVNEWLRWRIKTLAGA
jgi:hypothetical protein